MAQKRHLKFDPSALVRDARRQPTSMALPMPVHLRLDELVQEARAMNTSRGELVAMLITEADTDPSALEERLARYRKRRIGDLMDLPDGGDVVVPIHGPGRRKRDAG